jgi:Cytochrome b(C-terminal)/b6/petD
MFVAILILLALPFTDTSKIKGSSYKPLYIIAFWLFALNFLVLMWLGSCHVEPPFIVAGQIATAYYFAHFLILIPLFGIIDNVLSIIATTWIDYSENMLNQSKKGEDWRILFPSDPAKMTEDQKAEWKKIKEDLMKEGVIISPGMTGGSLVTFNIIIPEDYINLNGNFTSFLPCHEWNINNFNLSIIYIGFILCLVICSIKLYRFLIQ